MKTIPLCLLLIALIKVSSSTAMTMREELRNTFYDSNTCYAFIKLSPVIAGAIGGVIAGGTLGINYCVGSNYSSESLVTCAVLSILGGGLVGTAVGFGVAYVGIKTYRKCILGLQQR